MNMRAFSGVLLAVTLLSGCANDEGGLPSLAPNAETGRWYSKADQQQGVALFRQHCAVCHGQNAEGTENWRTRDAQGNLPPPPLNGSAHAWHHPMAMLGRVINGGGAPFGGIMPSFEGTLTDAQILQIIASFQSHWSDATYQQWLTIEQNARRQGQ